MTLANILYGSKEEAVVDDAVLWLPFHEIGGNTFKSADTYGHVVTVAGAIRGFLGYKFDGTDDQCTIPDVPSLSILNPLTAILWIMQPNALADAEQSLLHRNRPYIVRILSNGKIALVYHNGTGWQELQSNTGLTNGRWYQVAITRQDSGTNSLCTIYLNGVSDVSSVKTGQPVDVAQTLRIGSYDGASERFNGTIGEIKLYKRLLTITEITDHYNKTRWRYQ